MKVEFLSEEKIQDFKDYCKKHRKEVDESFLDEESLKSFEINEEDPTYIVIDDAGKIKATASLVMNDYYKRGKKARFRIFHSEIDEVKYYQELMNKIEEHTEGLDKVEIFIPLENENLKKNIESLNFNIERYSFLLVREDAEVPSYDLSKDYKIRSFIPGEDEKIWCDIRNSAFANLKGNETPITIEIATALSTWDDYIEGGMKILYDKEKPIGIVRGSKDEFEDLPIISIGPLAVLPDYQGKGLGRILLQALLQFAKEKGYDRTILCVNGENVRAKDLYIQEGFKQVEEVVCFKYDI